MYIIFVCYNHGLIRSLSLGVFSAMNSSRLHHLLFPLPPSARRHAQLPACLVLMLDTLDTYCGASSSRRLLGLLNMVRDDAPRTGFLFAGGQM